MSRLLHLKTLITEALRTKTATELVSHRVSPLQTRVNARTSPKVSFHTCGTVYNEYSTQTPDEKGEVSRRPEEFSEDSVPREAPPQENSLHAASEDTSIIKRLRRLSMTHADDYEPSPMAQEKIRELSKQRAEIIQRGEQWKWDQKNLRPGGAPPPRQYGGGFNRRDTRYGGRQYQYQDKDDYDEDYGARGQRRMTRDRSYREDYSDDYYEDRRGYSNDRQRSNISISRDDNAKDVPENYEVEMEKLRERLLKNKVARSATTSNQEGSERKNRTLALEKNSISLGVALPAERSSEKTYRAKTDEQYSTDYEVNLAFAADNPDTFGNLSFATAPVLVKDPVSEEIRKELMEEEAALSLLEEDEEDDSRLIVPDEDRWSSHKLIRKVRSLLEEKKLKEAVDVYLGVLKQGGFKFDNDPLRHHFNVLINECAEVGYVDMAFRLFNLMKKRGYKEKHRTISSLLNACANSPWDKENNLDKIEKLLINMKDRGMQPNLTNYHALIKAYGRLGETVRAFNVVDTMIQEARLYPVTATFNMLLQACITDTQNGFRYALITWRKMQTKKKIRPDIYSYNLLLRAIRDCGIELHEDELKTFSQVEETVKIKGSSEIPLLPPVVSQEDSNRILSFLIPDKYAEKDAKLVLDNLGEPTIVDVKSFIKALSYPTNRMAVLGGIRGILSQMVQNKVPPNLKTLTAMLQVSRAADIHDILQLLQAYKIKPDSHFFNLALHQCFTMSLHKSANQILKMMNTVYNIPPNLLTWAELAFGCQSWPEAEKLLQEMQSAKFNPDSRVMYNMAMAAIRMCDPRFVLHVLEEVRNRQIDIGEKFVLNVDNFISNTQKEIVKHEMGKTVEFKRLAEALKRNPKFGEHFALLKMRYATWINQISLKVSPENPWKSDWDYFQEHKSHKVRELEDTEYESLINSAVKNGS